MISNNVIENAGLCRSCLSEVMNVKLDRKDCSVLDYMYTCPRCRCIKNIVVRVRFSKRLLANDSEKKQYAMNE